MPGERQPPGLASPRSAAAIAPPPDVVTVVGHPPDDDVATEAPTVTEAGADVSGVEDTGRTPPSPEV